MSKPLAQTQPMQRRRTARLLFLAGRFVLGYVLAIAAGALLFSLVECLFPEGSLLVEPPVGFNDVFRQIWQLWTLGFVFGGVFALPYTIVGALVFRFLLPRNWITFVILGMLCPIVAFTTLSISLVGGMQMVHDLARLSWTTLPAGIVATYLFGAIAFGQGFGRWRFE